MKTSWRYLCKTCWRRVEDAFKTSWRRLEDVLKTFLQDAVKAFWRRLEKVLARRLEDVLKMSWGRLQNVLKTSWRCLENVFKTYGQGEYIGLEQDVLKTSWRRLLKTYGQGEDVRLAKDVLKTSWRCLLKTKTKDVLKMSSEDEDERRLEDAFRTSSSRRIFGGVYDRLHDFLEKKKSYFYSSLIFDRNVLPLLLWFISQIRLDERLIG